MLTAIIDGDYTWLLDVSELLCINIFDIEEKFDELVVGKLYNGERTVELLSLLPIECYAWKKDNELSFINGEIAGYYYEEYLKSKNTNIVKK